MPFDEDACHECRRTGDETPLTICRVCHKKFCEDHSTRRGGVAFCSLGCGVYFFHDDDDAGDDA